MPGQPRQPRAVTCADTLCTGPCLPLKDSSQGYSPPTALRKCLFQNDKPTPPFAPVAAPVLTQSQRDPAHTTENESLTVHSTNLPAAPDTVQ